MVDTGVTAGDGTWKNRAGVQMVFIIHCGEHHTHPLMLV